MTLLDAARSRPSEGGPSFSLAHRLHRAMWNVAWLLLASWTPPFFNAWRLMLLRLFGARISSSARIRSSARIWYPPYLEMGDNACLGPRVNCYCMAPITLGAYALASQGAHLCAGTHDIDDVHFQLRAKPIVIGPRAWIAADAFVGPGVTVGEGAVLGARGVAFKDLAPWTVYVGNPIQEVRKRRR